MSMERQGELAVEQAGERRSASVESIRALAALGVLISHIMIASLAAEAVGLPAEQAADLTGPLERLLLGGGLGVFLFFTLTGYLLFWPFVRAGFGDSPPVQIGRYARNRVLRILPLYLIVVIAVFAIGGGEAGQPGLVRYLTMTQFLDRDATLGIDALGPLWSVVVEVHFYLLLPLGAWALTRISRRSLRRAALIIVALGLVSLAVRIARVNGTIGAPPPFWRLNMPANFLFFVPGMLLALLRLHAERLGRVPLPVRLQSPALWIAASIPIAMVPVFWRYDFTPLIGISAFLLVGACVLPLSGGQAPVRAISWRPLALLGIASYSLYAWHVPVLEALHSFDIPFTPWTLMAAIAVPAAIAAAAASYRLIESPFLRLRETWSRDSARAAGQGAAEETLEPPEQPEPLAIPTR